MKPFPFVPLGDALICKKVSTDYSAGGIYTPNKDTKDAVCVAEVLSVSGEQTSLFGIKMPKDVVVGDLVVLPMASARKIGDSFRTELVRRGVSDDEIKEMFVAFVPNVMGKFIGDVVNPEYIVPPKIEEVNGSHNFDHFLAPK